MLNPFKNAVSALVNKWTGGSKATYKLPRDRRLALRREAGVIVTKGGVIQTTVFPPRPHLPDPKLLRIRRLHRSIYEKADNKQSGLKEGWVYCITSTLLPGWNSVGKASDYPSRLSTYNRADPFRRFIIYHKVYFQDRKAAEDIILARCEANAAERRGDWFRMPKQCVAFLMDEVFQEIEG